MTLSVRFVRYKSSIFPLTGPVLSVDLRTFRTESVVNSLLQVSLSCSRRVSRSAESKVTASVQVQSDTGREVDDDGVSADHPSGGSAARSRSRERSTGS